MKFKFKAVKQSGEHYEGIKEAVDKPSLFRELKNFGDTIISVEEESQKSNKNKAFNIGFLNQVSTSKKITLARNLGLMLESGLPMVRSLSVLEKQSKNSYLKKILSKIQDDINKGDTLSQSFSQFPKVFPSFFVSMIKAGEESGSLAQSLKSVADQMEKIYTLTKRLKGALIYPAIVITAMIIISILLLIFLVPTLTDTFEELNLELPLSTRIIIGVSSFLKDNTLIAATVLIFFVTIFYYAFKTKKGKKFLNFMMLKLPILSGFVKESNSAKTSRTLSSLLSSGVGFLTAIGITREVVQNVYYKKVLSEAEHRVGQGGTISAVLLENQDLYPVFVGEMAGIGEETGKLSEMLGNTASFYEDSIDQKTKNLSTIIEPLLMVLIGVFVGIFAVSMLGPIYSLVDAI